MENPLQTLVTTFRKKQFDAAFFAEAIDPYFLLAAWRHQNYQV